MRQPEQTRCLSRDLKLTDGAWKATLVVRGPWKPETLPCGNSGGSDLSSLSVQFSEALDAGQQRAEVVAGRQLVTLVPGPSNSRQTLPDLAVTRWWTRQRVSSRPGNIPSFLPSKTSAIEHSKRHHSSLDVLEMRAGRYA